MNLAELIRTSKGTRSYEDLARASGGTPGRQRWQQYATLPLKAFPDAASIRSIAGALGVSQRAVVLSCAESLDLDVGRGLSRLEQKLPGGLDQLDDESEAAVLNLLRVLLRPPPMTADGLTGHPELEERIRSERNIPTRADVALAAAAGTPAHMPDMATGEESQDPRHDEPA